MNSKRLYFIFVASIILLSLGLVIGTYQANKLITARATTLTNLKAKDQALARQQISINQSKKDIENYADLNKIAKAVVPEDKDQAQAVREIVSIANKYGVSLATISFPASTLGNTTGSASSSSATPPKVSASAGALSQLTAVKNIPGVYELQISVQSDTSKPVSYGAFLNFLKALERNRRTAQVTTISILPDSKNPDVLSFTLTLNEYIKP